MPSFRTLPDEEIVALANYVKYLTMRGQLERMLIAEISSMDDEPLLDISHAGENDLVTMLLKIEDGDWKEEPNEDEEFFEEQLDYIVNELFLENTLARWSETEGTETPVPDVPESLAPGSAENEQLVAAGRELFFGRGNCAQCHGETAMGDGQTANYDDWTNDWIKSAGVDPTDKTTYKDFLAAGALKPRAIRPRNLRLPVYRGGGRPEDLYRRIKNGIEGTPMPAGATLTSEEVWALVAYVKWLPYENAGQQTPKLVNNKAIAR